MERVFTVRRAEQDPNLLLFVVDLDESLKNAGHAGEVYWGGSGLNIDQPTVETNYITDEFGSWLRSYAPIHDSAGTVVGGVVVEALVDWAQGRMWPIAPAAMLALAAALGIFLRLSYQKEFSTRTLTESGSRTATFLLQISTKRGAEGQLPVPFLGT